jgi:predicted flap endonuclease-1-like 5' DNA nuclease
MWEELVRRWIDLVFWWWPRGHGEPPKGPESAAPAREDERPRGAAEEAGVPWVEAQEEIVPDDLSVIKGIGPVLQDRLERSPAPP